MFEIPSYCNLDGSLEETAEEAEALITPQLRELIKETSRISDMIVSF